MSQFKGDSLDRLVCLCTFDIKCILCNDSHMEFNRTLGNRRRPQPRKIFTTGEVAEFCGVNFRTVIRWIDRGHLKAFQLPGRGDRRIEAGEFVRFLKKHQMSIPKELEPSFTDRVLIVDDDESTARTFERILQKAGMKTEIALDGFQAGLLLRSFDPCLITLDLNMPGIDGFSVLKTVRQGLENHDLKILVVSSEDHEKLELSLKHGADAVLSKPVNHQAFLGSVQDLISEVKARI